MDSRDLEGRSAIVTGGSRGIGLAIAQALAAHGASVTIAARNLDTVVSAAEHIRERGGKALAVDIDIVGDGAADVIVSRTLEAFGGLDILVNNAGGNSFSSPVASMRVGGWEKTMKLNVDATLRMIQAAVPPLVASARGSIVNVGSIAGLRGSPFMAHYGAAKAAVASLTRSLAVEMASQGVRVNALLPGWVETDLTGFLREDQSLERSIIDRIPMGRWGRPEEIADAALFLASDASSFMTGHELVVDGGQSVLP